MRCRPNNRSTVGLAIQSITFLIIGAAALAARTPTESSRDDNSTPRLTVRVYGFAKLSPSLLQASELQAVRLLRYVPLDLNWVDCTSWPAPAICMAEPAPTDLMVRVLAKALPQASQNALGIAASKRGDAIAFVFYDRMLALRTHARPLSSIAGRVLAHEIVHVLLPDEAHSDFGLMRGLWSTDDLRTDSSACMGLTAISVQLMQKEVLRRIASARNAAPK